MTVRVKYESFIFSLRLESDTSHNLLMPEWNFKFYFTLSFTFLNLFGINRHVIQIGLHIISFVLLLEILSVSDVVG